LARESSILGVSSKEDAMKNSRSFEAAISIFKAARSYPAMLISAIALALGVAMATKAAAAETFVLTNGQTVEGSILQSTLNGIVVRRADIGIERLRHEDIDQVIIPTPRGRITGSWIGWADGVYALQVRDRVVRVRDGEIIGTGLGTPPVGRRAQAGADRAILDTPAPNRDSEESIGPIIVTGAADAAREDEGSIVCNLNLSRPAAGPIILIFATIGGTARPHFDFVPRSGVMTIEPGVTKLQLEISLLDDDAAEGEEAFEVYLTIDPNQAELKTRTLVATILDDDS
jgi:hypothetical protein